MLFLDLNNNERIGNNIPITTAKGLALPFQYFQSGLNNIFRFLYNSVQCIILRTILWCNNTDELYFGTLWKENNQHWLTAFNSTLHVIYLWNISLLKNYYNVLLSSKSAYLRLPPLEANLRWAQRNWNMSSAVLHFRASNT